MVDKISIASNTREIESVQVRRDAPSSSSSAAMPVDAASAVQSAAAPLPVRAASDVRLEIEQDKSIGTFIYKIYDKESGELIRQWPTAEMVKLREYVREQQLTLFDKSV